MLFGTTSGGYQSGYGYVYAATTSGSVRDLYDFKNTPDGSDPNEVTALDGVLYGTTVGGGFEAPGKSTGCGTFFAVPFGGGETVSSKFYGGKKGCQPIPSASKLLRYNGAFYGETGLGGLNGDGTVFVAHDDGTLSVLYNFGASNLYSPAGGLEELNGTLYGVTDEGGDANGDGAVFALTPSGVLTVLHIFHGADGSNPEVRLTAVDGVLYGSTERGGALDRGTIFAITPSGAFTLLHSFGKSPDGDVPLSSLLAYGGALIGSTYEGGLYNYGLIFQISYGGKVTRLHSFDRTDGQGPTGSLTSVGKTIYGTTHDGDTLYSLTY